MIERGVVISRLVGLWLLLVLCVVVRGQQPTPTPTPKDLIEPTRPTIGNSAEFQPAGVLQIEFGYDGNFHAHQFDWQQTGPLTLRFAATSRLLFEYEMDTVISQKSSSGDVETGVGDIRLGIQAVAFKETESHPALAFAYHIKVPTASSEKQLGTGRTDHRFVVLLSKKVGGTDINFNAAYLNVGRQYDDRRASGAQAALNATYEFKNNFGIVGEVAGQSENWEEPKGLFALGALTYKVNRRLRFDAGARFGLTPAAPRVGFFAGFTTAVGNPFK